MACFCIKCGEVLVVPVEGTIECWFCGEKFSTASSVIDYEPQQSRPFIKSEAVLVRPGAGCKTLGFE